MNPFLPLLLMMLGVLVTVGTSMCIGIWCVSATDNVIRRGHHMYVGIVLGMMVLAAAQLVELFVVGEPFKFIPVWLAGACLFSTFASVGFMRGLSIQKHKRWV
ncbi:MAG: hypothetical protein K2W95_05650 [Candidatus Obscuribacterales bacterium]|nr:hypothetical protein [Candidatus Obscuribacterales bacterium]